MRPSAWAGSRVRVPPPKKTVVAGYEDATASTERLIKSVKKTSRLVIAHEGWKGWGFGAEVSAMVAEQAIDWLDAPIVRVASADVPVPASGVLEEAARA